MRRILVPQTPGAQCAAGLLMTDLRADFLRTQMLELAADAVGEAADSIAAIFGQLQDEANNWLVTQGVAPESRRYERAAQMRYAGQNYELTVEVPAGPLDVAAMSEISKRFTAEHERMYGYSSPDGVLQAVTFRVRAVGEVPRAVIAREAQAAGDPTATEAGVRSVYLPECGGHTDCPIYDRAQLRPGNRISGPAVIEQMDSTTLLLPGDEAFVDDLRNLVVEVAQ